MVKLIFYNFKVGLNPVGTPVQKCTHSVHEYFNSKWHRHWSIPPKLWNTDVDNVQYIWTDLKANKNWVIKGKGLLYS